MLKFSSPLYISFVALLLISGLISSCEAQITKKIDYSKAYLVDVRTPQEFSEGHAEGSVNIPLNTIESQIDLFKDKGDIVVFCRSGSRSSQALKILEKNGIKNVTNGGTWQEVDLKLHETSSHKH